MERKIFSLIILSHIISYATYIPNSTYLKNIYNITHAQGIEYTRHFSEYEDTLKYGTPPNCINASDLATLNTTIDWNNDSLYQFNNTKNLYVAKITSAFISPAHLGTIFDNQQQLLFNLLIHPGYPIFWPIDSQIKNFKTIKYKKIATVQGPTYFYHWLIDRLPSILLLKKSLIFQDPEVKFIINSCGPKPYVYEYLELLGIPNNRLIISESNTLYYADTVYFGTPFLMEPIPKKLLLELRNELIEAAQKKQISRQYKSNLIVIIQRKESNRKIQNLDELLNLIGQTFSNKDYEIIIYDSSMPVSEQIQIFNNARLIIGAMASGMANLIYSKPGAFVIEIHPELQYVVNKDGINNAGNEWCWWLSSLVDLNYWVLTAPFNLADASIICPIEKMDKILKKIKDDILK